MPLLMFDVLEGRSEAETKTMLDAAHRAVLTAFKVPARDRYQIVHENKAYQMVIQDTGLGIERTEKVVVLRVFTSPRSPEQKALFLTELCRELHEHCGILPSDVMVSFINNDRSDWSFGNGVAQYLTGEL
ncbi:tautomerase family protein [Chimaeribacter arupi]|uniref:Tautomerase family protein n=1 Tax=Chimaeribacter arupi TaxID=2060066 RepID=A0A2N5EMK0_9GAMM|nr:tautomerase family protein [Chimaeribacter arupi]MDV5139750.1 tautomerase family protein [Chimaeribacter arupi]PLR49292.1 tautomerase family protein [Chimaeribacter arupi]PLR52843.1 tautomerase family protein [Chimaeribacter arupi]